MRPLITGFIVLGVAFLGYRALKNSDRFAPNVVAPIPATQPLQSSEKFPTKPTSQLVSKSIRKEKKHESKRLIADPDAQRPRSGKNEGTSISTDEIESLTSIYQSEERRIEQPEFAAISEFESPKPQSRSPIPGVKIAAWVRSNQDRLPKEVPDPKVGSSLRVFVNCVELRKKGASPLEKGECEKIVASKETVEKVSFSSLKRGRAF